MEIALNKPASGNVPAFINLRFMPVVLLLVTAAFMWFQGPPEGLSAQAWHLLIIFLSTIIAVILKPLPIGAITMVAVTLSIVTHTLTIEQCLSSFSSNVAWLIVMAFFMALGFKATGLGTRIAFFFISLLGRSPLGLSYGFVAAEALLAPFIPSNTARGAGIIFPVVLGLVEQQGSCPSKGTRKKLGAFMLQVCFQANLITSAMFLTGMVGNPLTVSFAAHYGVSITWGKWALAAIVPGILNLIIMPLLLYKIYPPTIKTLEGAQQQARDHLKSLGALKADEWVMILTFALILTLWIAGKAWNIDPTTAAMVGLSILLMTGVLKWKDCIKEKGAWETLMWFAPLLMMAGFLTQFGTMTWFSGHIKNLVGNLSWQTSFVLIMVVYYYVQYVFASVTARITSLYIAFLGVLTASGAPAEASALMLAVLSALSGSLTHFGTGTAPVYFGTGYVTVKEWWRNSAILSVANLAIWLIGGSLWWKVLGIW